MSSAGAATAASTRMGTPIATKRRRITCPIQRAPRVGFSPARGSWSAALEFLPRVARGPAKAMSAGTSVRLRSTATAMVAAAASPIWPRNGTPVTRSATSAMMTVAPAKTTALPAVPTARAIDGSMPMPSKTWVRWRERMNSV